MMTTVRDFLVERFGGSAFMWDVFLGVLMALVVILLLQLFIAILTRPFR
jgi:hypothetical protein